MKPSWIQRKKWEKTVDLVSSGVRSSRFRFMAEVSQLSTKRLPAGSQECTLKIAIFFRRFSSRLVRELFLMNRSMWMFAQNFIYFDDQIFCERIWLFFSSKKTIFQFDHKLELILNNRLVFIINIFD